MSGDYSGYDGLPPLDQDNGPDVRQEDSGATNPAPSVGPSSNPGSNPAGNPWSVPASDAATNGSLTQPAASQPEQSSPSTPTNPSNPSNPPKPRAARKPVLRYVPGQDGPRGSSPGADGAPFDDRTTELPHGYYVQDPVLPRRPVRPARSARSSRSQGPLVVALSILIVVGVIGALLISPLRNYLQTSNVPVIGGCGDGSPCQAATAYLADYGSANYESMYSHVSAASRTKFSSKDILGSSYKDAHDYIVNRTSAILGEAQITTIQTTMGATKTTSATDATVAAHIVMTSARVGDIVQDLSIPLTKESGKWMVNWTPGLIFKQLDDPNDPTYRRLVHMNETTGKRGSIFDSTGDVLAKDDTVYDIDVDTSKITNEANLDSALGTDLNMTPAQVKAAYGAGNPVRTITSDYYNQIKSSLSSLPGVYTQQRTARVYPYGPDLMAVTGYVSSVTPDDLKNDTSHYYCDLDDPNTCNAGDVAGHAGVEAWGEQYLRPVKGGTLVIVDRNADGTPSSQPLVTLGARQATNGDDVHTTISLKDQQAAMSTLRSFGYGAGAFAVDPTTGQVLMMASYPACDPNDFSLGFSVGVANCQSTAGAQINHALQSAQPVGSVFKVITLSAGLQNGVSPTEIFNCTGQEVVLGQTFHDFQNVSHGQLTAPAALAPSCDIIPVIIAFTRLNSKDPNILPNVARGFGFGSPTNVIGIPGGVESPGIVPDPNWLKQNKQADWTAIDAANMAVGQGFLEVTPAQVAMASAAIANNGARMQPLLVTSVTGADGSQVTSFAPKQAGTLPLSSDNLKVIQTAMLGPTTAPAGTAYNEFHDFPVLVAGKTGTAESGQQYPHSWFMSYAPASPVSGPPVQPKIAMAALVEYSAIGEFCAVPATQQVYRAQFGLSGQVQPIQIFDCQNHNGL